jgi:riboflavin biosynthesis pyrimidine reductase
VRQIYPVQGPDLPVLPRASDGQLPAAVEELARLYGSGEDQRRAGRPWLRANMVASTDGAASLNGRSGGLSGPADKMVFTVLRSLADVIMVGAGTARTERYRPVQAAEIWQSLRHARAPVPAIAIVSSSLHLDSCRRLLTDAAAEAKTIVLTTATAPADRKAAISQHARILVAGQEQVEMADAIRGLADLGYRNILTEGGPGLLSHIVAAGLLDDICLTTSPVLAAGDAGRIVASAAGDPAAPQATRLSLAHVLADEDYILSRYLCQPLD